MTHSKVPIVSNKERLSAIQALGDLQKPYQIGGEADQLFVAAMRECIDWHAAENAFYGRLLKERGASSASLSTIDDCIALPFIHANFFKTHEILSIQPEQVTLHLTSSGTTGQKSQIFFDEWSIGAGQQMVQRIFQHYNWYQPGEPANYLLFNYEPLQDWKVGTSYTANFLTRFAPVNRISYALKRTGCGGHEFDIYGAIRTLQDYAQDGLPVRIFGFPAFLHATLLRMQALGMPPLSLPHGSMAFFGGGWKGQADKAIPKPDFYATISEQLGLPDANIRDGYGSVEHSVPYVECANHRFHVPVWSRIAIRDVETLKPLGPGEPGFLNFISPYVTSTPVQSVLMGDLAAWHPGDGCGCGLKSPYFEPLGRAGISKNKSCAIAAAELLKGKTA
ncbi:hypothetical protein [Pseudochelatococcus sp. G4_1912]|uniref:LuxE/PaaK family acyltransferase n=1 Tax=Pseudochelatococcus sp. G4_1912 TaxID=3114288 RepID=UPI0039C60504